MRQYELDNPNNKRRIPLACNPEKKDSRVCVIPFECASSVNVLRALKRGEIVAFTKMRKFHAHDFKQLSEIFGHLGTFSPVGKIGANPAVFLHGDIEFFLGFHVKFPAGFFVKTEAYTLKVISAWVCHSNATARYAVYSVVRMGVSFAPHRLTQQFLVDLKGGKR